MRARNIEFQAAIAAAGGSVAGDPVQFAATFFPPHHDAHVKDFHIYHKAAMFRRASDNMAAAIKRAGSVAAFLRGEG